MAIISINYNESGFEPDLGYKSVAFKPRQGEEKLFDSGDFIKDWYNCTKYIITEWDNVDEEPLMHSSSVDHFIMDGAKFDNAKLIFKGDEPMLSYVNYLEGIEFFVPENTQPTWEELSKMVGHEKKVY